MTPQVHGSEHLIHGKMPIPSALQWVEGIGRLNKIIMRTLITIIAIIILLIPITLQDIYELLTIGFIILIFAIIFNPTKSK